MKNLYFAYTLFLNYLHSLSFVFGKGKIVFISAVFIFSSTFLKAQTYSAQCKKKCGNIQSTQDCGGGIYKIKWKQGNQWDNAEIYIKKNGTSIGQLSGWNYANNVMRPSQWQHQMRVTSNHANRWIYSKINNGSKRIDFFFSDFTCSSCTNGTANAGSAPAGICSGETSAAMGGSIGGGATAGTWSGGSGTWTNASNSSTATYTAGASESGNVTLTLTATGGCSTVTATKTITVTSSPSAGTLSGTQGICVSGSTTFSSTVSGGTWSSGNTGIATINSSSGAISGVSAGTATITYTKTVGSCSNTATRTVTVTAAPSAGTLSGTQGICVSGSTTFSSTVSGGTWSSGNTGIATINSSSGAISGVSAGTATITYTKVGTGGCSNATATRTVTVTVAPSAGTLSGTQGICVSGSTTFSSTVSGGTWSSSNTGIATINSSSGAISGVSAGTATITYTKAGSGGCSDATATRTVTVATPTVDASSNGSRTGEGTVSIQATASAGSIDWYAASSGGSSLGNSSSGVNWTTPSISTTTIYYAEANDGGCTSSSRTPVTAVILYPPGGVSSNLHLWLKADAGVFSDAGSTASTDGSEVQEWHGQSAKGFDADDSGGNGPDWDADGINFNPTLDFTGGASGEPLDIPNGIMEGGTKTDMYVYSVVTTDILQKQALFWQDLNTSNNTEVFSFIPHWNSGNSYWDNGYANGRAGPAASGITLGQPHLFSLSSTTNSMEIKRDNNSVATSTDNGSSTEDNTQPFYIGYRWDNQNNYFDGKLSELIIYDGVPTATEEDQIESYLAVKYGITLASTNYLSSDATVIWDNSTYSSYHYDIAGIGRDDAQGLHQKQSKSINSDAIVTMSTEAIATTNAGISTALTDGTYLLWGNNNSTTNAYDDLPAGYSGRLKKEWVVEMTGTVENLHVEFDLSDHDYLGGDAAADFYLITDADGDFTSGASEIAASSLSGTKVTFDDIDFTDGQYFTLGTKQPGPGGVANNLLLWLKADAGTNTTTNDDRVTSWVSQGTSSFTANEMSSDGPTYKTDGINGHPALDFSDNRMSITGGITEGETKTDIFAYVVSQRRTNGSQNVIFWQNLETWASGFYLIFRHVGTGTTSADFYYGHNNTGHGRLAGTWGGTAGQTHLWTMGTTTGAANTTPHGTRRYMKRDGNLINSDDNTAHTTSFSSTDFYIGNYNSSAYHDGLIAEIIILDETPTAKQDNRIRSYLNNKYGLTNGATSQDRINSNGTTIWPYNASYNTNIAGIRRDDLSGVDEKQAKSTTSGGIMAMSTQAIAATNAANTTQIATDKSSLIWAQKTGVTRAVSTDASGLTGTFTQRLSSEWLVKETGTVGNVLVEVDLGGLTFENESASKFGLVVDDDGDFTGGEQTLFIADNFSVDKKLTFNSVSLTGSKYVAIMNGTVAALPVELLYFEGKRIGSNVLLEWETMAEINNDYFIVEKSTDGTNWDELLTVNGQGNTSEQTYYSQIDIDGCNGTCYYRLTQVDFDGNSEKFKVVAVSVNEAYNKLEISVSPNPINQTANIAFTAPESGMFSITVTTQTGQVMYTANTMGDKGNNHISYNAAMLSSGSYYFILEDQNGNRTQQLVIK